MEVHPYEISSLCKDLCMGMRNIEKDTGKALILIYIHDLAISLIASANSRG